MRLFSFIALLMLVNFPAYSGTLRNYGNGKIYCIPGSLRGISQCDFIGPLVPYNITKGIKCSIHLSPRYKERDWVCRREKDLEEYNRNVKMWEEKGVR